MKEGQSPFQTCLGIIEFVQDDDHLLRRNNNSLVAGAGFYRANTTGFVGRPSWPMVARINSWR